MIYSDLNECGAIINNIDDPSSIVDWKVAAMTTLCHNVVATSIGQNTGFSGKSRI